MWRVRTGGRLHLGLLSFPAEGEVWPDREGRPAIVARRFGGVGLMIDAPGLSLRVEEAERWSAEGPLAHRVLEYARRVREHLDGPPRRLIVEQAPREHVGLGVGTQLGLAVARGLAASWATHLPATTLATWVGRGRRSALGGHGFDQGGFLVEGGKTADELSPLVARVPFPQEWRVLFLLPPGLEGPHGPKEASAFERLRSPVAATDAMCRLVLMGMLPAIVARDFEAFSESAYDYNARAGEMFAAVQGGTYSAPAVGELVHQLRSEGVRGVGQSSWGPGVFAFFDHEEAALAMARRAGTSEAYVAGPLNTGAACVEVETRAPGER